MTSRSQGWKNAKNEGHNNEEKVAQLINNDQNFKSKLESKIGKGKIEKAIVEGLTQKKTESVLSTPEKNDKTTPKTDLTITHSNGEKTNISIKKSNGGQVFLIGTERFILGFEAQFKEIETHVKDAIKLFFGDHPDATKILENENSGSIPKNIRNREKRRKNLSSSTLLIHDKNLHQSLIDWIKQNIYEITLYCFSSGLSLKEHAEFIHYIDTINNKTEEHFINIVELAELCLKNNQNIRYGDKNGGTTIILPFGHVQYHQGKMQFHHHINCISQLK